MKSDIATRSMVADVISKVSTGSASASALVICGAWASCGSWFSTRLTRSRTSLAASSILRSRVKVMLMNDRPSRSLLVIRSMPGIPASWRASG